MAINYCIFGPPFIWEVTGREKDEGVERNGADVTPFVGRIENEIWQGNCQLHALSVRESHRSGYIIAEEPARGEAVCQKFLHAFRAAVPPDTARRGASSFCVKRNR